MFRPPRFGLTMMAVAVVVFLLSGCLRSGPSSSDGRSDSGELVFLLNDSDRVRIPGQWRGDTLFLRNAQENLLLRPSTTNDHTWKVPVFDGTLTLINDTGRWHDALRSGDYRVPVRWEGGGSDHEPARWSPDTLSWVLTFGGESPWFGQLFLQKSDSSCRGSIATATGDFRYLHGTLSPSGALTLQTFDGAHLFRFSGRVAADGNIDSGVFQSGTHYTTRFSGEPAPRSRAALVDAPKASWTGEPVGYSGVSLSGDSVQWRATEAKGVHVLSVMGSWCPNCMDEHRLLLDLMAIHPNLHVHTLAFERGAPVADAGLHSNKKALERLTRYVRQMGLDRFPDRWVVRLVGPATKIEAQRALPFLDRVVSFPTTVVVHPGAREPWIHSGFNGPAMGPAHDLEVARFAAAISAPTESR